MWLLIQWFKNRRFFNWPAKFRRGCTTYLVRRNLLEIKWKSEVMSLKLQGVSVNTLREVNFSHAQSFSITIYLSGEKIDGIDSKLVHYIFYSTWLRILIQQVLFSQKLRYWYYEVCSFKNFNIDTGSKEIMTIHNIWKELLSIRKSSL